MLLNSLKTLLTDHVLHLAGIFCCDLFRYPQMHQPRREQLVPLINHVCNLFPGFGKIYESGISDCDMLMFSQVFHCHTYTGFFIT